MWLFCLLQRNSVSLELRRSSQRTLNHSVVCFLLSKSMYRSSTCQRIETQIQRSWKCCLCKEEDENVPISILDSNITQWKSLLSGKMLAVIVFAVVFACNKGSPSSVGLWGKGSSPGILTSCSPSQMPWPGQAILARELEVWFPPRICYEQNLLV